MTQNEQAQERIVREIADLQAQRECQLETALSTPYGTIEYRAAWDALESTHQLTMGALGRLARLQR